MEENVLNPRHTSPEDVYSLLREEILLIKIEPGQMISENSIADRFGLSRTPVRSILSRLAQEGLVVMQGRKGNYVSRINLEFAEQIIFMRVQLEAAALHHVINHPDAMLFRKLEQNLELQDQIRRGTLSPDHFYKVDSDFHSMFMNSAGRQPLWQVLRNLDVHYSRYRRLDYSTHQLDASIFTILYNDHCQLLEIMKQRQGEHVRKMISEHMYSGMVRIGNILYDKYPNYFDPNARPLPEILRDVRIYLDELQD